MVNNHWYFLAFLCTFFVVFAGIKFPVKRLWEILNCCWMRRLQLKMKTHQLSARNITEIAGNDRKVTQRDLQPTTRTNFYLFKIYHGIGRSAQKRHKSSAAHQSSGRLSALNGKWLNGQKLHYF